MEVRLMTRDDLIPLIEEQRNDPVLWETRASVGSMEYQITLLQNNLKQLHNAVDEYLKQDNGQLHLFDTDKLSFEFFWKRYPTKRGKTAAKKIWDREVKGNDQKMLFVWNALYLYLKEVRDARRRGFMQQFCHGDRFMRNMDDFVDYDDECIHDLDLLVNKVEWVRNQLKNEEKVSQQVSSINSNEIIL